MLSFCQPKLSVTYYPVKKKVPVCFNFMLSVILSEYVPCFVFFPQSVHAAFWNETLEFFMNHSSGLVLGNRTKAPHRDFYKWSPSGRSGSSEDPESLDKTSGSSHHSSVTLPLALSAFLTRLGLCFVVWNNHFSFAYLFIFKLRCDVRFSHCIEQKEYSFLFYLHRLEMIWKLFKILCITALHESFIFHECVWGILQTISRSWLVCVCDSHARVRLFWPVSLLWSANTLTWQEICIKEASWNMTVMEQARMQAARPALPSPRSHKHTPHSLTPFPLPAPLVSSLLTISRFFREEC